jgi:hypothetical protein
VQGGVFHRKDHIGNGVEIEVVGGFRHLQFPVGIDAHGLEGE